MFYTEFLFLLNNDRNEGTRYHHLIHACVCVFVKLLVYVRMYGFLSYLGVSYTFCQVMEE